MRRSTLILSLISLLAISAFVLLAQEKKAETITGTLVDLTCYAKAGLTTNDHGNMKNCGSMCVKGGLPVGVVDANKKVHFLGVAAAGYADLVGKEVRFTGSHGQHAADVFLPEKLEVKEGDKWVEKKLPKTMM
jgi:hypothetical protein